MDKQSSVIWLGRALDWWKEGLLACLPDSLQHTPKQKPILQCTIDGDAFTLRALDEVGLQSDSLSLDLNAVESNDALIQWLKPYQSLDVVLVLNDEQFLLNSLSLPAQAKDNIEQMIQFEIDRQTPFSADQVHIGYQFNDNQNSKNVSVTLAVVPKHFIANIVDRLASISFQINTLSLDEPPNNIKIVLSESNTRSPMSSHLNYWLAGLAVILALTILYKPIIYYDNAMDAIQAPLATAKKQVQGISQLKAENAALIEHAQFLDKKLSDYRSRIALLDELARVLPKHTWLEQLSVRDTLLTIQGESASASDLIALLTNSNYLTEVRFSAPTTTNDRTGKERFKIQALIKSQN